MNTSTIPDPLTPLDCDLRDFEFMPLHVRRLRDSDLASKESPEACWAAVLLWSASWHQVPAGSLPNDDKVLSNLAGYSRFVKEWVKVRAGALRGFIECGDGRLYHPVVAETALEAWLEKLAAQISSGTGNSKRWGVPFDPQPFYDAMKNTRAMLFKLNPQSRSLSKRRTLGIPVGQQTDPGWTNTDPGGIDKTSHRDRNRQGQGQRQGHGQGKDNGSVPIGTGGEPPAKAEKTPEQLAKAELWTEGRKLLQQYDIPKDQAGSFLGMLVQDYGTEIALEAVRIGVANVPGKPEEYLVATCKRLAGDRRAHWWETKEGTEAKAAELGLKARPGEETRDLKTRIQVALDGGGKPPTLTVVQPVTSPAEDEQKIITPEGAAQGLASVKAALKSTAVTA